MKTLLLSFDLEEFDLPREFGYNICDKDMFNISYLGLKQVLNIVQNCKVTFFVSCSFAKKYSQLIKSLAKDYEVSLHCLDHNDDYSRMSENQFKDNIKKAKLILEKIIGKPVLGFRAPRMQVPYYSVLKKLGFVYDSSYNPTFIPKRYNNFFKTRRIFKKEGIVVIPISTLPGIRLPLFWLSFRNLPLFNFISRLVFKNYLNIYFHPWEFVDLSKFPVPWYIKRNTGKNLCKKLSKFVKKYDCKTFSDFLKKVHL